MAEKIILTFSGWCECNPDRVVFVLVGKNGTAKEYINGHEYLALPEYNEEDEDAICRDDYMLESTVDAQSTAVDGNYDFWDITVEGE